MKTKTRLACGWIVSTLFSHAHGQGFVYDQQSSDESHYGESGAIIQNQQTVGQSFTPTNSAINFIRLSMGDLHSGNNLGATVYVNLWSGSISNSTLLSSTTPVFMPDGFAQITNQFADFFFPTLVALTPNSTYFFQPFVQSGDLWAVVGDNSYNYTGGTAIVSGVVRPSLDLWFREGVFTTPEPSSLALLIFGGGLFCFRRRSV
jgi:PEP-CTERM motif